MKAIIEKNMDSVTYHSKKEFVSNSMLSDFLRSPAHLQAALRNPPEQSKAFADGELIHAAILEPELLKKKYIAQPDAKDYPGALVSSDDLKAKCKELGLPVSGTKVELSKRILERDAMAVIWENVLSDFGTKHVGKTFVKAEELIKLESLVESVYSHDEASRLLINGAAELSVFWMDQRSCVKCRCRPDYYIEKNGLLIDVKTTEDARLTTFQKSLYNFGYYRQLAFYGMGLKAAGLPVDRYLIIAVEKSDPFAVSVFDVDSVSINRGISEMWGALKAYSECLKSDQWPAYPQDMQTISLPSWAF